MSTWPMHILTLPTSDSFVIDCHVCIALGEGTYIGIMVKIIIKKKKKVVSNHGEYPILRKSRSRSLNSTFPRLNMVTKRPHPKKAKVLTSMGVDSSW